MHAKYHILNATKQWRPSTLLISLAFVARLFSITGLRTIHLLLLLQP